jgi:methyl-accepting chemotaxis protein
MSVSGSIAEAVETFRKHAARKRRDEIGQSRARAEQASGRQAHLERLAGEFERTVGGVIEAVGAVVAQLEHASQNLSRTSSSTDQLARTVAGLETRVRQRAVRCRSDRENVGIGRNIVEVNDGARQTGAASTQVLHSAKSLADASGRLRAEVADFLVKVRLA